MVDQYKDPYLESSCFIAWIKDEVIENRSFVDDKIIVDGKEVIQKREVIDKVERGKITAHVLRLAEEEHFFIGNDAVHLTCALRAGCDVLLTWDNDFNAVVHPQIRIEQPQIIGQLKLGL